MDVKPKKNARDDVPARKPVCHVPNCVNVVVIAIKDDWFYGQTVSSLFHILMLKFLNSVFYLPVCT